MRNPVYFLYYVIEELKRNDLPIELAFLPFIESSYDPFSISSSGAVGLWQIMPRTADLLGLKENWWIEERHNPYKSTDAAIRYIDYLYKRFNQDISGWDISNVDDMRGLLKDTEDFNQDLTGWNVDGVTQCDEFILNAISMTPDKIPNFTNCDPNYENPSSGSN